jgi:hypothetical protein
MLYKWLQKLYFVSLEWYLDGNNSKFIDKFICTKFILGAHNLILIVYKYAINIR